MKPLVASVLRKVLSALILCMAPMSLQAQTAPDFTLKDCNNVEHNLYADVDAGKVVVIVWVMPCGACALPTLTTGGAVRDIDKNYPGKVKLYFLDDFGDTECAALRGWLKNYSIPYTAPYIAVASVTNVPMTDYGAIGMPKIIAVGGAEKNIIYNSENDVDGFVLRDRIIEQLSTSSVQTSEEVATLSPQPVNDVLSIRLQGQSSASSRISIVNARGEEVETRMTSPAEGQVSCDVAHLPAGLYVVRIVNGTRARGMSFIKH